MEKALVLKLHSSFEEAVHIIDGMECWYARELQHLLGYSRWEGFENALDKAKVACENSHNIVQDHFQDTTKMIDLGKGAIREVDEVVLTRYACYLIAQNGDSRKSEIAYAQSYFALQTRKMELVEKRMEEFERLNARERLTISEKEFSKTIYEAGVDSKGFGRIRSNGDKALFGFNTAEMKKRLGIGDKPLANGLHTVALKAKDLVNEMTGYNIKKDSLHGEGQINNEHVNNNKTVRKVLIERGIQPENLPVQEDSKKLERRVKSEPKKIAKEAKKQIKPDPLFNQNKK